MSLDYVRVSLCKVFSSQKNVRVSSSVPETALILVIEVLLGLLDHFKAG